jgi:hypothetical protein
MRVLTTIGPLAAACLFLPAQTSITTTQATTPNCYLPLNGTVSCSRCTESANDG